MMYLLTSFKAVLLVAIVLMTGMSSAHSVHHHDHDHVEPEHSKSELSVDELIEAYSKTGNDELLVKAWNLLTPELEQADVTVWLRAAWLAQSEHNFELALDYIEKALELRPRHAIALLLKANTAAVTGNLTAARSACTQTFGVVETIVTQACFARLAQSKQQQTKFLKRLQMWPDTALDNRLEAWVVETVAMLASDVGQLDTAELAYKRALALNPTIAVNAAYADVLLAQNRPGAVVKLIDEDESTPALALRRLLAAKALRLNVDNQVASVDRKFHAWYVKRDFRHAREMALFYVFVKPDLVLAKELAELNVESQREPIDLRLARYVGARY